MEGFPRTVLLAVLAILALATPRVRAQVRLPAVEPPAVPCFAVAPTATPASANPQFECGQPNNVIDGMGWVFGIPRKIVLWDRRAVNHNVSPQTQGSLAEYLNANGMTSTKVRINEYDPGGEWRRLGANKSVGAGWRYTLGAFGTLAYTLFPGRLFGADGYNPYTDSVYIYSDIPCVAQEQAAYAKLIHQRECPGTYVAVTSLPFVRLWPEKQAKDDVLNFAAAEGTPDEKRAAIHAMYPEYGAEIADEFTRFVPGGFLLTAAGAGLGHAAAHFDADVPAVGEANGSSAVGPVDMTADGKAVVPVSFDR
jgi:hypothetical protein